MRYETHPLFVESVTTVDGVGGDVSTDGVTDVFGSVGVEFSTCGDGVEFSEVKRTIWGL